MNVNTTWLAAIWVMLFACFILLLGILLTGCEPAYGAEAESLMQGDIELLKQRVKFLEDADRRQHESFVKHLEEHVPKWRFDQVEAAQQTHLDEAAFQRGYDSEKDETKTALGILAILLLFGFGFWAGYAYRGIGM